MNLKAAYTRFKQWQIDPFEYKVNGPESHKSSSLDMAFGAHYGA